MWHPSSNPHQLVSETKPDPARILYEYDGPQIFVAFWRGLDHLFYKLDDEDAHEQFLAVPIASSTLDQLEKGELVVRQVFSRGWCALLTVYDGIVIKNWFIDASEIPDYLLPDPNVALYPWLPDIDTRTATRGDEAPYFSIKFAKGELAACTLSFDVFRTLVDNTYDSLRRLFVGAIHKRLNGKISDSLIAKNLYIPIRQPIFSSLLFELEKPLWMVPDVIAKQRLSLDFQKVMDDASNALLDQTERVVSAAEEGMLSTEYVREYVEYLTVLEDLLPQNRGSFHHVSFSYSESSRCVRSIEIDEVVGTIIHQAIRQHREADGTVSGTVVELSLRSSSFIIKTSTGREITCSFSKKGIGTLTSDFKEGMRVSVDGRFERRKRRDYMKAVAVQILDAP